MNKEEAPKYHIKFAVCGMSHDHIYGMIGASSAAAANWWRHGAAKPDKLRHFTKRFPNVKIAKTQDEILNDPRFNWC
jgi:hypothetical protein